jgi:hypothetical protein
MTLQSYMKSKINQRAFEKDILDNESARELDLKNY